MKSVGKYFCVICLSITHINSHNQYQTLKDDFSISEIISTLFIPLFLNFICLIFIYTYIFYTLLERKSHATVWVWKSEKSLQDLVLSFHLSWSWVLNSGNQAQEQVFLPTNPSCECNTFIYSAVTFPFMQETCISFNY